MNKSIQGFTLVELSIVLVIIGLIVSGIVSGQSLIHSSRIKNVVTQIGQIQTAVRTFELQYAAVPGDMADAEDYWGTAANCYAAAAGTATCNGDGSGKLAYVISGDSSDVEYEPWHFWKQLANADMIAGEFSGYSVNNCGRDNYCLNPGVNALAGPFDGSGWFVYSAATYSNAHKWQGRATNQNRNILVLGNPQNHPDNNWGGASLSTKEQYSIDKKIDDGLPYQGVIVDMSGTSSTYTLNCASANSSEFDDTPPGTTTINATYRLDRDGISTTEGCLLHVDL